MITLEKDMKGASSQIELRLDLRAALHRQVQPSVAVRRGMPIFGMLGL